MLQLNLDFGIVFEGLMSGELSSEQAAVLFRERKHAVGYYLPDRLGETLRDPRYKDTTDLDCPAGRLLDTYWRVFGPAQSVILFCSYDLPLVDCFLNAKLRDHLDEFTDTDLATFERVAWG